MKNSFPDRALSHIVADAEYRILFENAGDAIYIHDNDRIFQVNKMGCSQLGYTAEELMAMKPSDVDDPEYRIKMPERIEALNKYKWISFETVHLKKDGSPVQIEATAQQITWNGQPAVMSICRNITRKKRLDNDLLAVATEWRSTFDSIKDAVFLLDSDSRVLRCNKAAIDLFRKDQGDIVGHYCWEITHGRSEPIPECPVIRMKQSKKRETAVLSVGELWLDVTVDPIFDEYDEICGAVHIVADVTERKRMEDAFQESQRMQAKLLENLQGMAYRCSNEMGWTMEFVSAGAFELTGYRPDELINNRVVSYGSLIHPDDRQRVWDEVQSGLNDFRTFILSYRIIAADGTEKWVAEHGSGLYSSIGELIALEGLITDVTKHKRTEKVLLENELKFRSVFDFANDAIFLVNEGVFFDCNLKTLEMFCCEKEDVIGHAPSEFSPEYQPDGRFSFEKAAEKINLAVEGQPQSFEWTHIRKDGLPIETEVSLNRIELENKLFLLAVVRDISKRKRAENALQKQVIALSQPLDNADGIKFTDLFSMESIQRIQDEFSDATGVASIITQPDGVPITRPSRFCRLCNDIIRKTDKGLVNCLKSDAEIGRHNPSGPIISHCLSGGLWDAGASITVGGKHIANWLIGQVRNDDIDEKEVCKYAEVIGADPVEFRKAFSEVTLMSKAQFTKVAKSLYTLANELSLKAYQNIQQARYITENKKMEERIRHSEKMEAVGQLAGGIAHDFNNQLMGIIGYAESLHGELKDDKMKADMECILQASRRAADLTKDLLAFSRKGKYLAMPVDMHKLIEDTISILSHSIDKRIEISNLSAATRTFVKGDPAQLQNVLLNLAINSRDALSEGGKIVFSTEDCQIEELKTGMEFPKIPVGTYIKISVADNGIGMDEETQKHIFEPFFTTKDPGKGTGMGLPSVYGTIIGHGGGIDLKSRPGQGSAFFLYLPVLEEAPALKLPTILPATTKVKARILLVDDDAIVRKILAKILSFNGHSVFACNDGLEALEYYRKSWGDIDIVVMDMQMPRMDGKDAFLAMKSVNPAIKALIISGFSVEGEPQCLFDAGVRGFLQKPFNNNVFIKKIDDILTDV